MTTHPTAAAAEGLPKSPPSIPGLFNVRSRGLNDLVGGPAYIAQHSEISHWLALWPADGRPYEMHTATMAGDRDMILGIIIDEARS
jgi:hypothetical protein